MARKDDPYGPVRKQDPYVTGRRGGYNNGGEGPGDGGSGGSNDEGCGKDAAQMVIAAVALGMFIKGMIKRRK